MNSERDSATRIVLSWLREDAHENPERMLLRALAEVDATTQRRARWPAWRSNLMNTHAKLIVAAAAVVAVAVVGYQVLPGRGGIGAPSAAPSAIPSPTASPFAAAESAEDRVPTEPNAVWSRGLDETFTSAIYGISLRYPTGWTVRPATKQWTDEALTSESPAADVIVDPRSPGSFIVVASQPLSLHRSDWGGPPPTRLSGGVCGGGGGGRFEIDGAKAFDWQCERGGAVDVWTATRGYVIIASASEPEGRALFNAVLGTVDLRPEDAVGG